MEIYELTDYDLAEGMSFRFLKHLMIAELVGTHERIYAKVLTSTDGRFGIPIWPNDINLHKNYRDVIISSLKGEQLANIKTIDRDDEIWFPNVKTENEIRKTTIDKNN